MSSNSSPLLNKTFSFFLSVSPLGSSLSLSPTLDKEVSCGMTRALNVTLKTGIEEGNTQNRPGRVKYANLKLARQVLIGTSNNRSTNIEGGTCLRDDEEAISASPQHERVVKEGGR